MVAYDLPIGFGESFDDREFWIRLRREADWTQFTDAYFDKGELFLPAMPAAIDRETVADVIARARAEEEKNNQWRGA